MTQALWLVLGQMKRAGCGVFPFAGTLLGLERDGRLLPNDKNVDLAVWLEDFQLACRTLEAIGFARATSSPPFGNVATFVLQSPRMSVDLFGLRRASGGPIRRPPCSLPCMATGASRSRNGIRWCRALRCRTPT